jgi:hypothetical protein
MQMKTSTRVTSTLLFMISILQGEGKLLLMHGHLGIHASPLITIREQQVIPTAIQYDLTDFKLLALHGHTEG